MRTLIRLTLAAALLPALGGCMAMAVTGAVVGAGVAVGKGAVSVASAPFRGNDDDDSKRK